MKKFIDALDSIKDLHLVCNLDGVVHFVGGIPTHTWTKGEKLEAIMPPDLASNIRQGLNQSQEAGEIKKIIYCLPSSQDSKQHWIRILCISPPHLNEQLGICLFQDITRNKELEQQNLKLTKAIEQSAHSVIITNLNGETEYVNQHFLKNSGYSLEEIIGKKPGRIVNSGVHDQSFYQDIWTNLKYHDSWSGEFCNRKKNGELYWDQATIAAVRDENGKIINYISIQSNITEQKKAIWELEKSKTYSEKLNRILGFALEDAKKARLESENASKAKSEFLANMSHEIRTPMNSLVGMIDLFRETPLSESQKKYLDIMDRSSQMLLNLINDVLDLSRIEAGFIELDSSFFNLEEVIDTISDIMRTKAHQKGIDLILDVRTPINFIMQSDPVRLRQVLLNLVSNAVKFTDKGKVTITVDTDEHEKNRFLILKISDTGIGIPHHKLGQLFSKFSQLSNSPEKLYGGSGLGLVITKKIVEKMDGVISVESEFQKGSIFTVKIPLKDFRQKNVYSNLDIQISVGQFKNAYQEILLTTLHKLMPQAHIKADDKCIFCIKGIHCNQERVCDFFIWDCDIQTNASEELHTILNRSPELKPQVLVCLTHEQRRIILQQYPNITNIHLMDKPMKRRELYAYLTGDKSQISDTKKINNEDLIRQKLKVPLRILLVDDSEDNRILMVSFLQKIPTIIDIAENGAAALELSKKGDYDVTFMDMQMPIMDGYHAMKEIRNYDSEFNKARRYIVALSAFAFADEIEHSYQAGCDYYLTKPIKKNKLMEVILLYIKTKEILG